MGAAKERTWDDVLADLEEENFGLSELGELGKVMRILKDRYTHRIDVCLRVTSANSVRVIAMYTPIGRRRRKRYDIEGPVLTVHNRLCHLPPLLHAEDVHEKGATQ